MSKRYAVIVDGKVDNVILWDGETDWVEDANTIALADDSPIGPGYAYDGVNFVAPSPPPQYVVP